MPMPCSDHAVILKAKAQHGRRETACGLLARFRLLPATTRSSAKLLSDADQSQMQVASVIEVVRNVMAYGDAYEGK